MKILDSKFIRASEIQSLLKCSRMTAYNVLKELPTVTLAYTKTQPPKAAYRTDFMRWLSDNNIVLGGANE